MERVKINLSVNEREELERFSKVGVHSVRLVTRAKVILALDTSEGRSATKQQELADRLGISRQAVNDARRDFLSAKNTSDFLKRKKRETPPVEPKVTGELEARIIALACGQAPEGYSRWNLRLLANKCVELKYSDSISHMTIKRLLKKHNLSLT